MSWIKRNLYFFAGSVLTLVLMGAAGWYLYTKWQLNGQLMQQLDQDYATLDELNKQKPHPGTEKINNIQIAKEQQQQLRTNVLLKAQAYFKHISPIPDDPKPTDQAFSSAISRMIDQLQHQATNASVSLPQGPQPYSFSFEAEKSKISFAAGSLGPLATQLGEVKTLCDILFACKVNSLDNIRRERVSPDDANGPQSDYLTDKSLTNELAVLTPYELKFRSFSAELGSVLSGFASSPYGFVVKSINVEPAPATVEIPLVATPTDTPRPPVYVQPRQPSAEAEAQMALQRRYGLNPGGLDRYGAGGDAHFGDRYGTGGMRPPPPQPVYVAPQPTAVQPGAATGRGGLPTVLDERPLQITLTVVLVKLLPPK